MKFDTRHKNTVISIIVISLLILILSVIRIDTMFAGLGLFYLTEIVGIIAGILFLFLRIVKIEVKKINLLYNYFGTLNLLLGITLFSIGLINNKFGVPVFMIINIFLGGIIYYDIYRTLRINTK